MKNLLIIAFIFSGYSVYAQKIVVFGKEELCDVTSGSNTCVPAIREKQDFLNIFNVSDFSDTSQVKKMDFITPPMQWGKRVMDSVKYGGFEFYKATDKGFIFNLKVMNMLSNHKYVICLNGNPSLEGNTLLPDPVPGNPAEKYYDFLTIRTNAAGAYQGKIGVYLNKGDYNLRMYIKDQTDHIIVLYHDFFKFKIR